MGEMNTLVDLDINTILAETESIIAETENVEDGFTGDMLDVIRFSDIRDSAEELELLIERYSTIESIKNESINLYQNIKYILEHCENEIFSTTDTDILNSFDNMRTSVDNIRSVIDTFLLQQEA